MKNIDEKFVGISQLNLEHKAGLEKFRQWAADHDWSAFHSNHYDWWMFPISAPSSMGFAYVVYESEVAELLAIPGFGERHAEGAMLLLKSWGWDSKTNSLIPNPESGQVWSNWPIRLYKCAESMKLFGQTVMYESCLAFARHIKSQGVSFIYNNRDLAQELGI
ncbi:MAG: hypothetical protein RLZZ426_69 [Actinomycetota bacterium]|jgi:hypothetical protein